jgi:hypothetical protein
VLGAQLRYRRGISDPADIAVDLRIARIARDGGESGRDVRKSGQGGSGLFPYRLRPATRSTLKSGLGPATIAKPQQQQQTSSPLDPGTTPICKDGPPR